MVRVKIFAVINPGEVVLETADCYLLCIYERDERLRKESGWYIARVTDKESAYWVDFARPGFGLTYWIYKEVAQNLWLDLVKEG